MFMFFEFCFLEGIKCYQEEALEKSKVVKQTKVTKELDEALKVLSDED